MFFFWILQFQSPFGGIIARDSVAILYIAAVWRGIQFGANRSYWPNIAVLINITIEGTTYVNSFPLLTHCCININIWVFRPSTLT
ncbi:hypothetical protein D3C72_2211600 [compost metagenome]